MGTCCPTKSVSTFQTRAAPYLLRQSPPLSAIQLSSNDLPWFLATGNVISDVQKSTF